MIQREMNLNSFEKFYCKFEIDFQINLGVLFSVESFQMYPPINQILVVYYLNASQSVLVKHGKSLVVSILLHSTVPLLLISRYEYS